MRKHIFILLPLVFLLGCTTSQKSQTANSSAPGFSTETSLTQEQAERRAALIKNVQYNLEFDFFPPNATQYTGIVTADFEMPEVKSDLTMDFFNGQIDDLEVNGVKATIRYNRKFLTFDRNTLKVGTNQIRIRFTGMYSPVSQGLRRFVDPQDQRVYLSTTFEPFGANRMFPCFDQPDLKATFKLTVRAPKDFVVVSNTRESSTKNEEKGAKIWEFPQGPKMSTYLFALMAGPFHVFEDHPKGLVPLRLFVRKSMASYVDPKEWFTTTAQGLHYFTNFLQTPYPFSKYDQILVPEMGGAMENIAAVAFGEGFISRGEKSTTEKRFLADVILHEMAHQWFGDLVTMKWWNDLWLNESFADFMGYKALAEATPYKESWQDFINRKNSGLLEDEKSTTHPIVNNAKDTLEAWANFDGITYPKGASVLKQLLANMGEPAFRAGIANYFKKFSYANAELKDFVEVMSTTSGKSLTDWQNLWLKTAGFNVIETNWTCDGGKLKTLDLRQTPASGANVVRPHSFRIALLEKQEKHKEEQVLVGSTLNVRFEQKSVSIPLDANVRCPWMVIPNYGDDGYMRWKMPADQASQLLPEMSKVKDNFLRHQLWLQLWDMVRTGQLNVYEYRYWLVKEGLEKEQDPLILRTLFDSMTGSHSTGVAGLNMIPKTSEQELVEYQDQLGSLEDAAWKRFKTAAPGSDLQKIFFDGFSALAETKLALDNVRNILEGRDHSNGFKLDQDKRWRLVYRLARTGQKDAEEWIARELKRDPSNLGQEWSIAARAVQPDWDGKTKFISQVKIDAPELSKNQKRRVIMSLFPNNQEELRARYESQFYADLIQVHARDPYRARDYLALAPNSCLSRTTPSLADFLRKEKLSADVQKHFQHYLEDGVLCQKALALARKASYRAPDLPQVPDTRKHRRHRRHRHRASHSA